MMFHLREAFEKNVLNVLMPVRNSPSTWVINLATSSSGRAMTRPTTRREMSSVVGRNGRISTRDRSGTKVGPMRLAWRVVVFNQLKSRLHGLESEH